jgi:hypothetical protein
MLSLLPPAVWRFSILSHFRRTKSRSGSAADFKSGAFVGGEVSLQVYRLSASGFMDGNGIGGDFVVSLYRSAPPDLGSYNGRFRGGVLVQKEAEKYGVPLPPESHPLLRT